MMSFIFEKAKTMINDYFGNANNQRVVYCVLTLPAWFNDTQKYQIKDAATIAGNLSLKIFFIV